MPRTSVPKGNSAVPRDAARTLTLISCRDAGRSFPLGVALFRAVWPRADRAGTEFQPGLAHSAVRSPLFQQQWALTPSTPVGSFGRMMSNPRLRGCLATSRRLPHHLWPSRGNLGARTSSLLPLRLPTRASSSRLHRIAARRRVLHPPQKPPQHRTRHPPPSTPPSPLPTPAPRGHWTPIWPWSPNTPLAPSHGSSPHHT